MPTTAQKSTVALKEKPLETRIWDAACSIFIPEAYNRDNSLPMIREAPLKPLAIAIRQVQTVTA